MEAQEPVNQQLHSDGPEGGQLNLQDQEDVSPEPTGATGERPEPDEPEDGQPDLQDREDVSPEYPGAVGERAEPDGPEDPQIAFDDRADGEPEGEDAEDERLESENLVSDQLDLLIGEIDRAVGIIGQLREDITALEQRNGQLRQQLEEQDQVISGLQAERERLRSIYANNASLIENKEEIQRKIEAMISRLDSVNTA